MKKMVVALMILSSLVSCGKKNAVSSSIAPASSSSGLNTNSSVTGTVETQLAKMIDDNQFGNGLVVVNGYQENWNQYISQMPGITYKYGNSSCGTSLVCYDFFGESNTTTTVTRTVINSSVDVGAKKNELKELINNRLWVQQRSATVFTIKTSNGKIYTIDTSYPLQANPYGVEDAAGKKEYFLGASL
jgi:hypothetical protein